MGCLYKESLINLYGEEVIESFISSNSSDVLFELYENLLKDKDRDHNKSLYAFENYLIKHYDTINNDDFKNKFNDVIENLYDAVSMCNIPNVMALTNASSFFKSTLTREELIEKFANDNQKIEIRKTKQAMLYYGKQIAEKYDKYFERKIELIKNGIEIEQDNELKKYELNFNEKKLLINFFSIIKNNRSDSLEWARNIQEKYFVDLLSDPDSLTTNIYEQEFLVTYAINNFYVLESLDKIELSFTNDIVNKNIGGYATGSNFINVNVSSNLNKTNLDIVQTACHETEHIVQAKKIKKNANYNDLGYYYLICELTRKYPQEGNDFDKEYNENYEYMEVEIDAEKTANMKLKVYIEDLYKKYSLDTTILNHRINELNENVEKRRPTFISRKRLSGKSVPIYHYNIERLSQIIQEHPNLISEYPMLNIIFNKNGKLISIEDILKQKPINNQLARDYILNQIYNNKVNELNTDEYNQEERINFIDNISICFEKEIDKIISFIKNPQIIKKNDDGPIAFVDDVNMINRLTKIFSYNMDFIENNKLTYNVFLSINNLLNIFNDNMINIERMMNSNNIYQQYFIVIKGVMDKVNDLNYKYNLYRYNDFCNVRRNYVLNNNLLATNERIVEMLINQNKYDDDFLNYRFMDNTGNLISVSEFINTFVKYNMIDNKVINFNRNDIPIESILDYLYQLYNQSKELANNDVNTTSINSK